MKKKVKETRWVWVNTENNTIHDELYYSRGGAEQGCVEIISELYELLTDLPNPYEYDIESDERKKYKQLRRDFVRFCWQCLKREGYRVVRVNVTEV